MQSQLQSVKVDVLYYVEWVMVHLVVRAATVISYQGTVFRL